MPVVAEVLERRGSEEIRSGVRKKKWNAQFTLCAIQGGAGKSQP